MSPQNEAGANPAATGHQSATALLDEAMVAVARAPAQAHALAVRAADAAERVEDMRAASLAWRMQGQALRAMGRHAEAVPVFEQAARRARLTDDPRLEAQVQMGFVDTLGMLGRHAEAVALGERLVAQLRAASAQSEAAKLLVNLGGLHFRRDEYRPALDRFTEAAELLRAIGDAAGLARARANQANALMQLGRTQDAARFHEDARNVFADAGMDFEAAVVDNNLGYLHTVTGRHAQALSYFAGALRAFEEAHRDHEAARCGVDMAEAYRALNLFPEALECGERALAVFSVLALDLDYDRARAEMGSAVDLMSLDRRPEAHAALRSAERVFRELGNNVQLAHVRLITAQYLRLEGRLIEARAAAEQSADAMGRAGLAGWAAEGRCVVADLDLEAGHDDPTKMLRVAAVARRCSRGWLECRAERSIGKHYARQDRTGLALKHMRRAAVALEAARTLIAPEGMHVSFLRDKQAVYEDLVATLIERGRTADIYEALECVERSKSRLLLERVQAALPGRAAVGGQVPRDVSERVSELRAELSRLYQQAHGMDVGESQRLAADPGCTRDRLADLEMAYRCALHEAEISARSGPETLRFPPLVSPSEVQAALGADEALVEFCTVNGRYCAFVVTRDRVVLSTDMASTEDVAHAARRLRFQLQRTHLAAVYGESAAPQILAGAVTSLQRLYDLLLRPLQHALDAAKLVIVPYGALHGLPFHAFNDGADYALDRWEIIYAPSAAIWHVGTERPGLSADQLERSLVIGVPVPGVEHIAEEVVRAAGTLPGARTLLGNDATLEAFGRHAGGCHVVHLATHAQFREDNPLFSGLALADGWLLARDLYGMTVDCDLATLSACQTGVAGIEAGDEPFGLVRGFLAAGARSVTASFWPTHDEATADTMDRFYSAYRSGRSYAASLRDAQQGTRNLYPHPYHWAAFALFGRR